MPSVSLTRSPTGFPSASPSWHAAEWDSGGLANLSVGSSTFVASSHTCAIRRGDGNVTCWGLNQYGQADAPPLPTGAGYAAVAAGAQHTCALLRGSGDTSGEVVCWGEGGGSGPVPPGAYSAVCAGVDYSRRSE
eukprot:gene798-biopygen25424